MLIVHLCVGAGGGEGGGGEGEGGLEGGGLKYPPRVT